MVPATFRGVSAPETVNPKFFTFRALALGLGFALFLAAFTPWNDYVLNNTPMIGSALPTALLLYMLVLVLINAPLHRWTPKWALSARELTLVLALGLVACAVPAGGVMRYLVGNAAGLQYLTGVDDRYRDLFQQADLPDALFPNSGTPVAMRSSDPVIRDFYGRIPIADPSLSTYLAAIPWSAWVVPFFVWGAFFALLVVALLSLAVLVRRQWVENERLPFPLATIYLSLLQPPEPGRVFNATLASRMFWIAAVAVFVARGFAGLNLYFPRYVPELPLGFDLQRVLAGGIWQYVETDFKRAEILFAVVGITFFLSQKVAFSLVFFYVLFQVIRVGYGQWELDFSTDMQRDQLFGAIFPYTAAMVYVARGHLMQVMRAMAGLRRPTDPASRYMPDALAGWLFIGASLGMVIYLTILGVSIPAAVCLVVLMLMFFVIVARIVAETGMPYVGLYLPLTLPFTYLVAVLPQSLAVKLATKDFFVGQILYGLYAHDHRESLPPYATHALRVADETLRDPPPSGGVSSRSAPGGKLIPAMAVSIGLAFVVSFVAWLMVDYRYASPVDRLGGTAIVNIWGAMQQPRYFHYEPTLAFDALTPESNLPHSRGTHFTVGAGVMTFLSVMRLRYEAFPFHPIGFLMAYTLGLKWVWFSVLLGYIAKGLTLKLGGATLYRRVTPLFLGLIIGEAAAAFFWLVFNLGRYAFGFDFTQVKLLPG